MNATTNQPEMYVVATATGVGTEYSLVLHITEAQWHTIVVSSGPVHDREVYRGESFGHGDMNAAADAARAAMDWMTATVVDEIRNA